MDQVARPPRHDTGSLSSQASRVAAGKGRGLRTYSAERTWRTAGVAGAGSLVALVSVVALGPAPHQRAAVAEAPRFAPADTASVESTLLETVPIVAPVATPAAPAPAVCANTYTVRAGDYWIRIADSASVPLGQLLTLNHATAKTALYPDQTVCLPDGTTVKAPTTTAKAPTTTVKKTTVKKVTHMAPKPAPVTTPVTASRHS